MMKDELFNDIDQNEHHFFYVNSNDRKEKNIP